MKRLRNVKILATLGPASSDEAMIQKLHEAGADLFRINMSHSSHELMRTLVSRIRAVGFDMDFTLAQYKQAALDEATYYLTLQTLVEEYKYPESILKLSFKSRISKEVP